jgi:hypothetical protein
MILVEEVSDGSLILLPRSKPWVGAKNCKFWPSDWKIYLKRTVCERRNEY